METVGLVTAILSIVSAVVSAALAGYFWGLRAMMIANEVAIAASQTAMDAKVKEFDNVTRAASAANNSIAEQVIAVSNKLKMIEDKVGMMAAAQTPRGRV